ncbi:MAG: double-strand break repair helicase AddA [Hyphomicrobiales bacterium]
MSADFAVDERTKSLQATASNPALSAWVAANAGSGKTYVLARRVIRLLLAGADPSKILCLTFTKAAAAEMSARVFDELANWATLSDEALSKEIGELTGKPPNDLARNTARQLFAKALETPGGLKIQTIHAFCERLLHQFPVEANVAGHFEVLDDVGKEHLINEAQRSVLLEAADHPTSPIANALSDAIANASDTGYQQALSAYLHSYKKLDQWLENTVGIDGALQELAKHFGISSNDTAAGLKEQMLASPHMDDVYLESVRQELLQSSVKFKKMGEILTDALQPNPSNVRVQAMLSFFFTQKEEARKISSIASKDIVSLFPDLEERVAQEQERLSGLLDKQKALATLDATRALLILGSTVSADYQRRKADTGMMDFDDLIEKAAQLLEKPDAAAWVHFKLDQGLDHILVDEAQDTSPRQWDVVSHLASEFFTGESARLVDRTMFAVGDEKQSIYSFQGASPEKFSDMREHFIQLSSAAQKPFEKVPLSLSFRSTADVLGAVDLVFANQNISEQLTSDYVDHSAARLNQPGSVEVWKAFTQPPKLEHDDDWWKPLDRLGEDSEKVALAKKIATEIKTLTAGDVRLEGTGEIITAGDVLILTRKRGPQVEAINRALKSQGVPVAGSDRLKLLDNIAILDLMALADFVLLSEDDLALAGVLKSPLIGLSEDELFDLSHDRRGTLWSELYLRAQHGDAPYVKAHQVLDRWRREADFVPPFDFFLNILSRDLGRRAFLTSLGAETDEVLDAFLLQVQTYEQSEVPTLQGFVSWFRDGSVEIKRDMESSRDEVRVMTVHGAKGLEAPIVFLVDGGAPYHAVHQPDILGLDDKDGAPFIWKRGKEHQTEAQAASLSRDKQSSMAEYYRLLYVAMTRARDRLYVVSTADKKGATNKDGWYATIFNALSNDENCQKVMGEDGEVDRWRWQMSSAPALPAKEHKEQLVDPYRPPHWLSETAPEASTGLNYLSPSKALGADELSENIDYAAQESDAGADMLADIPPAERGTLMHRLLERLPTHSPAEQPNIAARYLSEILPQASAESRAIMQAEVLSVLSHPDMAGLFDEKAKAEVTVAGRVDLEASSVMVRGQIDRLVVSDESVHIVDFKTHRKIVTDGAERKQIERQLALYAKLLMSIYPDKEIMASILWTSKPQLETLEFGCLENALKGL